MATLVNSFDLWDHFKKKKDLPSRKPCDMCSYSFTLHSLLISLIFCCLSIDALIIFTLLICCLWNTLMVYIYIYLCKFLWVLITFCHYFFISCLNKAFVHHTILQNVFCTYCLQVDWCLNGDSINKNTAISICTVNVSAEDNYPLLRCATKENGYSQHIGFWGSPLSSRTN